MCSTLNVAFERKVIWFIFIFVGGVLGHMCEFVVWMLCTYWSASFYISLSPLSRTRNRMSVRSKVTSKWTTWARTRDTSWNLWNKMVRKFINAIFAQGLYRTRGDIQKKQPRKKSKKNRFEYISMFYGSLQFHWNNKRSGRTLWQRTPTTSISLARRSHIVHLCASRVTSSQLLIIFNKNNSLCSLSLKLRKKSGT